MKIRYTYVSDFLFTKCNLRDGKLTAKNLRPIPVAVLRETPKTKEPDYLRFNKIFPLLE